jgi:uncharacterized membrane protein (DUF485 family)
MGFNQRSTIANLGTTLVVFAWYFYTAFQAAAAGETSVAEFAPTMWWTLAIYVGLIIAAMIVSAIFSRDEGDQMGEFDERDKLIDGKAETWSGYVAGVGLFGILYLITKEPSTFMLAQSVLAVMVLQTLTSFVLRLYLYNR